MRQDFPQLTGRSSAGITEAHGGAELDIWRSQQQLNALMEVGLVASRAWNSKEQARLALELAHARARRFDWPLGLTAGAASGFTSAIAHAGPPPSLQSLSSSSSWMNRASLVNVVAFCWSSELTTNWTMGRCGVR